MLADELKNIIEGEVLSDEKSLTHYSTDASIFEVRPEVVVAPRDSEDVKALVRFVRTRREKGDKHISITARSAGTDMGGGPLGESIIVDFTKHFNRIKEIKEEGNGGYTIVEPGVYYRNFERAITEHGLLFPPYPASKDLCAIGGIVANNSGGEKTLAYGKTEDYVRKLTVVLSDGEEYIFTPLRGQELEQKLQLQGFEGDLYRRLYHLIEGNYGRIRKAKPDVTKNSAGYFLWNVWDRKTFDITKLIVGSQGTLGLVTEVTFKLVKGKRYSRLTAVFLKDLALLTRIVAAVLPFNPESFESYDDNTLKLALRFFPDMLKLVGAKNVFKLALDFIPEMLMVLRSGRLPKLVLLVELTSDDKEELERRLERLARALSQFKVQVRVSKDEVESEKYWTIRRHSFSLLRQHIQGKQTAPFIDDFAVRAERLSEFLPRLNVILDRYKNALTYTIAGHVGDGNFHIIPLVDLSDPGIRAIIPKLSDEVYSLVLEFDGSITAEHNDGLIRTPYLEKMYGPEVTKLFKEVKQVFDPLGIFNPHKKVDGDLQYAMRHIKMK